MRARDAVDVKSRPFLAGLVLGLAHAITFGLVFPPFDLWPFGLVTLVPLVVSAARTSNPRRSAAAVWLGALPVFAYHHVWLIDVTLPGTPLLVMYLSLYPALYVLLASFARVRLGPTGLVLAAALLWTALEFFRSELFLQGYPWFLLGHATPSPSGLGAYVVTLLLTIFNTVLALLCLPEWRARIARHPWISVPAMIAIAGLVAGLLLSEDAPAEPTPTLRIAVVQTDVPQSNKLTGTIADKLDSFDRAIALTLDAANAEPSPELIVWPETMVPVFWGFNDASYDVEERDKIAVTVETPDGARRLPTTYFRDELTRLQSVLGIPMLVGATAVEGLAFDVDEAGSMTYDSDARYNSVFLIEDGTVNERRYDKLTLTPFGEVMPYISNWEWLERQLLALGARGMSFDLEPGEEDFVFEVENGSGEPFRIATPICFEITYAETCRRLAFDEGERMADVIINLTNDGWFGGWDAGRELHLDSARWRAVELGTPVVRAANTGISTHIDRAGRETGRLPPNEPGVLVVDVAKGAGVPSLARIGFLIPWGVTIASLALLVLVHFQKPGRGTNSQDEVGSNADDDQRNNTNAT